MENTNSTFWYVYVKKTYCGSICSEYRENDSEIIILASFLFQEYFSFVTRGFMFLFCNSYQGCWIVSIIYKYLLYYILNYI